MSRVWVMSIIGAVVIVVGLLLVGPIMSDVEHPQYEVIEQQGSFELRQYQPMIIAEVAVEGERDGAIRAGFKQLADFIFGNNSRSEEIAMTAPVQQQSSDSNWRVSFVMPAQYSLDSLPEPVNSAVQLRQVAARCYVAHRFSGSSSRDNIAAHEQALREHIAARQYMTVGEVLYAFYNPPWTLPAMRRNEVMMELRSCP